MRRRTVAIAAICAVPILGMVLILGLIAGRVWAESGGDVYTVRTLQAALARHPAALVGDTVRVRGMVPLPLVFGSCSAPHRGCDARPTYLLYPAGQTSGIPGKRGTLEFDYEAPSTVTLPLVAGQADRLLAAIRLVPMVGRLAPAPQRLRYGVAATYRVRVELAPVPSLLCVRAPCRLLILLDPAPDSL